MRTSSNLLAAALAVLFPGVLAAGQDAEHEPATYVRLAESAEGELVLEVCSRTFVREDGPSLTLAGAVHLGEPGYYSALQAMLDAHDVTLYEGVGDLHLLYRPVEGLDQEQRAELTRGRLRTVAAAVLRAEKSAGRPPQTLGELGEVLPESAVKRLLPLVSDGWGRPLVYSVTAADGGFTLQSLGADGLPGGEGADADIGYGDLEPLRPEEIDPPAGLQRDMARALGLAFQLDAMHIGPRWRHCDLSLEEIERRLAGHEELSGELFGLLSGDSALARVASLLLRFVGSSKSGSAMVRMAVLELLGRADALFAALPEEMDQLMKVLIVERNEVVVATLGRIAASEPEIRSVAVFYGAGHLADLERRIRDELDYLPGTESWLPAARVTAADLGTTPQGMRTMRRVMSAQLDKQLELLGRKK